MANCRISWFIRTRWGMIKLCRSCQVFGTWRRPKASAFQVGWNTIFVTCTALLILIRIYLITNAYFGDGYKFCTNTPGACTFNHFESVIYGEMTNFLVSKHFMARKNAPFYYGFHKLRIRNVFIVQAPVSVLRSNNPFWKKYYHWIRNLFINLQVCQQTWNSSTLKNQIKVTLLVEKNSQSGDEI